VIDSLRVGRDPREDGNEERDREKRARVDSLERQPPTCPERDDCGVGKSKCCQWPGVQGGEQGSLERENAVLPQYYRIQRGPGQHLEVSLPMPTERRR